MMSMNPNLKKYEDCDIEALQNKLNDLVRQRDTLAQEHEEETLRSRDQHASLQHQYNSLKQKLKNDEHKIRQNVLKLRNNRLVLGKQLDLL